MSVFEYKANENAFEVFLIFNYAFDESIPIDEIPVNCKLDDDFLQITQEKITEAGTIYHQLQSNEEIFSKFIKDDLCFAIISSLDELSDRKKIKITSDLLLYFEINTFSKIDSWNELISDAYELRENKFIDKKIYSRLIEIGTQINENGLVCFKDSGLFFVETTQIKDAAKRETYTENYIVKIKIKSISGKEDIELKIGGGHCTDKSSNFYSKHNPIVKFEYSLKSEEDVTWYLFVDGGKSCELRSSKNDIFKGNLNSKTNGMHIPLFDSKQAFTAFISSNGLASGDKKYNFFFNKEF